jgi:hypothetical protein
MLSGGHHAVNPTPQGERAGEAFFIGQIMKRLCSIDGCDKPEYCKRMCKMHYFRMWRAELSTRPHSACAIEGCSSPAYCKQMCKKHYNRVWRNGDPYAGEFKTKFESHIVKTDSCWIWNGPLFKSGYGRISNREKKLRAHRVSYEFYVGPIPDGLNVLHRCDNPLCVNPDHLFVGTHLDNMKDMEAKGRAKWIQENLKAKR